jgi:hypothetical protein
MLFCEEDAENSSDEYRRGTQETMNISCILFSQVVSIAIVICSQIYFPRSVDMTWEFNYSSGLFE